MDAPAAPTSRATVRAAVHANGVHLSRWLNISRSLTVAWCALSGLLLPVGAAWVLRTAGGLGGGELLLLSILAALLLLQGALVWWVVGWTREYLNRVRAWALGQGVDGARTDALRRTLRAWLTFAQWGLLVLVLLLLGMVPLLTSLDPDLRADADGGLFAGVWALVGLVSYVPAVVINWLVLASVRRWMDAVTDRALGRGHAPVTPSANLVSTWFIVLMVLVGLSALSALPALLLIPALPLLLQDSEAAGASLPLTLLLAATLVLSFASYALMFLLLLWSRGLALGIATLADMAPALGRHTAPQPGMPA